jgi:hypothetical protein
MEIYDRHVYADVHDAEGFGDDPAQLTEDTSLGIGTEIHQVASLFSQQQARSNETRKFLLNLTGACACVFDNLAQIKTAVGVPEQEREHPAPRFA